MLKKYTTDFLAYCKVADFSAKSIESLATSLREFTAYAASMQIDSPADIRYGHLSDFVADFNDPSIHKKKARVWCLHQFFHFLTLAGHVKDNIALGLPYPKIEKTIPYFLTIEEFNRLIKFFWRKADSTNGLRNLVMILMLGLLGLRTGTLIALDVDHIDYHVWGQVLKNHLLIFQDLPPCLLDPLPSTLHRAEGRGFHVPRLYLNGQLRRDLDAGRKSGPVRAR